MTHDEVVAKATDLMSPVFGATQTKGLIDKVLNLEKVKNITELRPFASARLMDARDDCLNDFFLWNELNCASRLRIAIHWLLA